MLHHHFLQAVRHQVTFHHTAVMWPDWSDCSAPLDVPSACTHACAGLGDAGALNLLRVRFVVFFFPMLDDNKHSDAHLMLPTTVFSRAAAAMEQVRPLFPLLPCEEIIYLWVFRMWRQRSQLWHSSVNVCLCLSSRISTMNRRCFLRTSGPRANLPRPWLSTPGEGSVKL